MQQYSDSKKKKPEILQFYCIHANGKLKKWIEFLMSACSKVYKNTYNKEFESSINSTLKKYLNH